MLRVRSAAERVRDCVYYRLTHRLPRQTSETHLAGYGRYRRPAFEIAHQANALEPSLPVPVGLRRVRVVYDLAEIEGQSGQVGRSESRARNEKRLCVEHGDDSLGQPFRSVITRDTVGLVIVGDAVGRVAVGLRP